MMSLSMCSVNRGTWSTSRISAWSSSWTENSSTNWRSSGAPRSAIGWKTSSSAFAPALVAPTESRSASAAPVTGDDPLDDLVRAVGHPPGAVGHAPGLIRHARGRLGHLGRPRGDPVDPVDGGVHAVQGSSTRSDEALGLVDQRGDACGQVGDDLHGLVGPPQDRADGGGEIGGERSRPPRLEGAPRIFAHRAAGAHTRSPVNR